MSWVRHSFLGKIILFVFITGLSSAKTSQLMIESGNLFALSHPRDDELAGKYRVDYLGRLHLPYGVKVVAAGKTFVEVVREIKSAYRLFYQRPQQVKVSLIRKDQWLEIEGLVSYPGWYLADESLGIGAILHLAGGPLPRGRYLSVESGEQSFLVDLERYWQTGVSAEVKWFGGGRFFVSERAPSAKTVHGVTVSGAVLNPRVIILAPGMTVTEVLREVGGFTPQADLDQIFLLRDIDGEVIRHRVGESSTVDLQAGDILWVGGKERPLWERVLMLTGSVATLISAILMGVAVL